MKTNSSTQQSRIQDPLAPRHAPHSTARQRISFLNATFGCKGERYIDHQEIDGENRITFGFKNLMVYNPNTLSWIALPDKFYVTAETFGLAQSEFWARWKMYVSKRFGLDKLYIEVTSTTIEN